MIIHNITTITTLQPAEFDLWLSIFTDSQYQYHHSTTTRSTFSNLTENVLEKNFIVKNILMFLIIL